MNDIVLKVQEGTTIGTVNLCKTCRNSVVSKGLNNERSIACLLGGHRTKMTFEVFECNKYLDANKPTLYEMEEIAWRLITKQGGRAYGFIDAEEFRKTEEGGIHVPPARIY